MVGGGGCSRGRASLLFVAWALVVSSRRVPPLDEGAVAHRGILIEQGSVLTVCPAAAAVSVPDSFPLSLFSPNAEHIGFAVATIIVSLPLGHLIAVDRDVADADVVVSHVSPAQHILIGDRPGRHSTRRLAHSQPPQCCCYETAVPTNTHGWSISPLARFPLVTVACLFSLLFAMFATLDAFDWLLFKPLPSTDPPEARVS